MRIYDGKTYRDMTADELTQMEKDTLETRIAEAGRPLTDGEILRLDMRRRVNSLSIDYATAGRMVDCFPSYREVCGEGELISAGTRVRDDSDSSVIWRANVDLWNTTENSPENAPTLWERIEYLNGIRVAPAAFTSTNAAGLGEYMWFGSELWKSAMAGNNYEPTSQNAPWERIL